MLYVGGSNLVEGLVAELLGEIQKQRGAAGFYKKIHILTPNPTINTFLEFELAKRSTVCANVEFTHLHKFLGTLAEKHPDLEDVTVLNRSKIQVLVHEFLANLTSDAPPVFHSVIHYILAGDTPQGQQIRQYQLSMQLAKLFEEYDYSRQEILAAWARNENYFEDQSTETWQRAIWYEIFGNDGIVRRNNQRFMPLSKVFETYRLTQAKIPGITHLHVFGFQHISATILNALQSLSRITEIFLWMLQPGAAEPVPAGASHTRIFKNHAHPAVAQWAASASDMLTVLSKADPSSIQFHNFHQSPDWTDSSTALEALRADIYETKQSRPTCSELGNSVAFLACPGIQREIEVVANDIWSRILASNGTLRFNEIGVAVAGADREEYAAQIRSVFKSFHDLPRSFVGLPSAEKSPIVEAFTMLLQLPFTNFGRRSFMNLLLHPNIQASVEGGDSEAWTKWCDNLSILFGADREDQSDTYIEKDFYNWSQGLKRLALGTFLSVETDEQIPENERSNRFEHANHTYLVEPVSQSQVSAAARMSTLTKSLIADARWLHDTRFTLTRWAAVFEDLLTTYIRPAVQHKPGSSAAKQDRGDIGYCKHLVTSLANRDLTGEILSYRTASLMLLTELDALDISREGDLHRGIVIGTPTRLSQIPFKHTYIVGFGEGHFPSVDRDNPMDLRQVERQDGDEITRDRDRQIFLNLILNARQSLSMSWVARDATADERLEPSSLMYELKNCLRELMTGTDEQIKTNLEEQTYPLRRYDDPNTLHPEAQIEARLVEIGQSLRQQSKSADKALPDAFTVAEFFKTSSDPHAKSIEQWLQMPPDLQLQANAASQKTSTQRSNRPLRISLSQLRNFLESPLQGAAKIQLRMHEEEEDTRLTSNEPFAVDRMNNTVFLRKVFNQAVLQGLDDTVFEDLYDEMLLPFYELKGTLPTGFFLDKTRREHLRILEIWRKVSNSWIAKDFWAREQVPTSFYFSHNDIPHQTRLEPLLFEVEINGVATAIELTGSTSLVCTQKRTVIINVPGYDLKFRDFGRGYVDYLALTAAGKPVEKMVVTTSNPNCMPDTKRGYANKHSRVFEVLAAQESYDLLHTILQQIFGMSHGYLLPIDILNDYFKKEETFDAQNWVVNELEKDWITISDKYGPIKNYVDFQAPPDWKQLLHQRFQYFPGFPGEGLK